MESLIEKFNDLPENAQYVIYGAGALVAILILVLLAVLIMAAIRGGDESTKSDKVKMPKRLPIAPIPIMSDREHALYEVLRTAMASFPNYDVHAKVSTSAMLGSVDDEHPKVAQAIMRSMVLDGHDFVIVDRSRFPVAVVELDSNQHDAREEQARQAGLPIIRVKDPRVSSKEMAVRLRGILK